MYQHHPTNLIQLSGEVCNHEQWDVSQSLIFGRYWLFGLISSLFNIQYSILLLWNETWCALLIKKKEEKKKFQEKIANMSVSYMYGG